MSHYLILPKIKVRDCSALSSSLTIGFPSMSAWFGCTHYIQRELRKRGFEDILFKRFGVISNEFELKKRGQNILGYRKPLNKEEKVASFLYDPKCNLKVSLIIEYENLKKDPKEFKETIHKILKGRFRIAGGSVESFEECELIKEEENYKAILKKVMPGFALIQRRDLLLEYPKEDYLEGIIDYCKLYERDVKSILKDLLPNESILNNENISKEETEVLLDKGKNCLNNDKLNILKKCCSLLKKKKDTYTSRKTLGWIVPISVGYKRISKLCKVENQRNPEYDHAFVESVLTLGEFKLPTFIENIDQVLWNTKVENGFYICEQGECNDK
jgi:CRISPR-associated protein Csy2